MTLNIKIRLVGLLTVTSLLGSCKHQDAPIPALIVTATTDAALAPTIVPLTYTPASPTQSQPGYVFDWENAQYVPNPPTVSPVPVPWSDQAKRAFSDDIRYDFKKADGWEMVYSTFASKVIEVNPFLMLYNKYRGILRYYFYIDGGTQNIAGNNVMIQKLDLRSAAPSPTPLLNFAEQAIVDVAKNSLSYSTIEPQAIGNKTWYAVQAELAYDASLAKQSYQTVGIQWLISSDLFSSVAINAGKSTNMLPVGIHIEGTSFYNSIGGTFNGSTQLLVNGARGITNLQTAGQDVSGISANLAQTTTGNLLSGILTAQTSNVSSLLPVPVTVQLTSPGRSAGIAGPDLALPGYDNSQTGGLTPQYNEAPDVFYLDGKPVVTAQTSTSATGSYVYTLEVASVRYLFNPATSNVAAIKNIRQEIVATGVAPVESVMTSPQTLYAGTTLTANQPLTIQGVRVSFDVVPRNGSAPVHIIKTFRADIKTQ